MNLYTRYLGLTLRTPLVVAASPLGESLDQLKCLEDAGAAAIVLPSLFAEQLRGSPADLERRTDSYLEHLTKGRRAVGIPLIASLNCAAFGRWVQVAREVAAAGANALELNIYSIPTDPGLTAEDIEDSYLTVLAAVKAQVKIPVAVKLSPFFTNFARFAHRLDRHGADGLVLFNRFYQPDIDLETLTVVPSLSLSTPTATRLPLRWIAMLRGRISASLAATSGIHRATDVLKMVLAGADVTMLCSVLFARGIGYLATIERELCAWMERRGEHSIELLKGRLSQQHCSDPSAFERAQYVRAVSSQEFPALMQTTVR